MSIAPEIKSRLAKLQQEQAKVDAALVAKRNGNSASNGNGRTPSKSEVFGEPWARKGENIMSSRGFQFQRLLAVAGKTPGYNNDNSKIELDLCGRMYKNYCVDQKVTFTPFANTDTPFLAPLGSELLGGGDEISDQFRHEIKSLTVAGVAGADPSEMSWIAQKAYQGSTKAITTPQSWLNEGLGGALVAPPEFGELIQLLRNKDALINAGCRVVPMPPSGRIKFPRQIAPTLGYWIGENTNIPSSNFNTSTLLLSSKKVAALVGMPNELIRFASPASEALLRADMTKTLSLTFDYACLQGPGTDNTPLGVINTPNIYTVTPTTVGTNGNTLSPQDLYSFISGIEANNAEFQGWIMRPEMFYLLVGARTSVYNGASTSQYGPFAFDQFRQLGQGWQKIVAGFPAVTTAQVSITQTKGNASNLTYVVGGQWDDSIMALFGAIEFAQATQGDSAFQQDQTLVRAILTGDFGLRHPAAFAAAQTLTLSVGN
jgi:HK97 family phage major capsid protein